MKDSSSVFSEKHSKNEKDSGSSDDYSDSDDEDLLDSVFEKLQKNCGLE